MSIVQFPTDLKSVKDASQKVLNLLSDSQIGESVLFDIKLCFEEAMINAIKHGNKLDKRLTVDVEVIKRENDIEIIVSDQGEGFDHFQCEDPTKEQNLEKTSGRGVFLIKKLMDKVIFEKNGSRIRMIKTIK